MIARAKSKLAAPKRTSGGARPRAPTPLRPQGRLSRQKTLDTAARLACQMLKGDMAAISLADEEGRLTIHSHFGLTDKCVARLQANAKYRPLGFIADRNKRARIIQEAELRQLIPDLSLRSMVVMPLKSGNTVIGFLGVGYQRKRKLGPQELQLARLFADYASIGIETAALYQKERDQRRRSGALLTAVGRPSARLSLKDNLTKLCRSVLKLSVAERCAIFLLSEDRQTIEAALALGGHFPISWNTTKGIAINELATAKAIDILNENREPLIAERARDSGLLRDELVGRFNIKSFVGYPLTYRRRPVGLLLAYTLSDYVSFPEEEVATLSAIAKQAATIIENALLYEREKRQRQRSETLTQIVTAAASTLDLQQVLSKVCEAALALTLGDEVSIFLINNETGILTPMTAVGRQERGALKRFLNVPAELLHAPETKRMYRAITGRKRPLVIEDAASSPLISHWWVENFGTKSLVHYPLRVKDKTIGSMAVASHSRKVHFPKEEIETLAAIAKQVAVVIENARIYDHEQSQRKQSETLSAVLLSHVNPQPARSPRESVRGDDDTYRWRRRKHLSCRCRNWRPPTGDGCGAASSWQPSEIPRSPARGDQPCRNDPLPPRDCQTKETASDQGCSRVALRQ